MNENKYLLDTNAVIALLEGNSELIEICNKAEFVCMSIINKFEFLTLHHLNYLIKW